ncbi:hypothetical protein [Aquamicrobium sp. LC103]|uniref:hypothetical protein n=1 Tax=Aquamicrobium sp. LC103 TaxID=1120658 RepID=UPI00063EB53A|nr:hypothetical protein [Aquamicrobium sp. LC103]TKT82509.1 hypothetical protein XW59_000665 [Aquamicrobium sp. LC103]
MKSAIALSTSAALVALSLLSVPASADERDVTPGTIEATSAASVRGIDTRTTSSLGYAGRQASFESATGVKVVSIGALTNYDSRQSQQILSVSSAALPAFKASAQSNPALARELQAQGVNLSQVVGVETAGNGVITLYVM